MEERIFKPLQMNQTLPSNDELTESMEIAYPHLNGEKVTMYDFHATKAAASIHSNITDLSKWVRMLLEYGIYEEEKLMEESTVRHLYTPQIVRGVSKSMEKQGINFRAYALGWSVHDFHGKKVIEHNGGMPGYISKVTLVPQENLGLVVLNNGFEFFVHNALKNEILQYFITKDEQDWISMAAEQKEKYLSYQAEKKEKRLNARVEGTNPSLPLSSYKGKYVDRMYGEAIIEMDGDKAILTLLPTKDHFFSEMKHWHYDTFRVDFKDPFLPFGLVTFDFNEKGNPIGFKIDLPINDFHFHNLYFQKTE
jgi:hypothetical protein